MIAIASLLGLAGLGNIYLNFAKYTVNKETDPYRKYIPTKEELLQNDLKISSKTSTATTAN